MEYSEFLNRLRAEGRGKFYKTVVGGLRTSSGHCPLSFVAGTSPCMVAPSRIKLGIDELVSERIVHAADRQYTDYPERRELIEALGL